MSQIVIRVNNRDYPIVCEDGREDRVRGIAGYIDGHDYGPTVREIASHYGWTTNGVAGHLKALRRKGRITWQEGQSRTIRVVRGDA